MTERSVFLAALEIADPATRAAYLDEACGTDSVLRRRIEELLAVNAGLGSFMDQPADACDSPDLHGGQTQDSEVGKWELTGGVGNQLADRYLLGQEIGSGGMGTVFRAEQVQPVKRSVAVKLIKPGMDSRAVLARFETERQSLALMDHPNIATVLDGGVDGAGRPFFVMELVNGVVLTDYCDSRCLTILERLDLFRQVCWAVQHAHQKGIIHRDLKPSNVLVEEHNGRPVVKVIDFGLAKAVQGGGLLGTTQVTAPGALLGTPLYMAPEQASFGAIDIDTRADVYALGGILYEILTGVTAFDQDSANALALEELLRVIREVEPPAPSSRLCHSARLSAVAALRRSDPSRLVRALRGELDWIVIKALEKDRSRRYESVTALISDVDHFLKDEPVSAGPPTLAYRLRKFVRRHRAAVLAVGLIGVALIVGMVGTTLGFLQAAAQRDRAREASEQAELASDQTYQALDILAEDSLEELLGRKAVWGDRERAFLRRVEDQFVLLVKTTGDSEAARRRRAFARLRLGSVRSLFDNTTVAETDYQAAVDEFDELMDPEARSGGAQTRRRLAGLLAKTGRKTEAMEVYRSAADAFDRLTSDYPSITNYRYQAAGVRNDLGVLCLQVGEFAAAESHLRASAVALAELAATKDVDLRYGIDHARTLHNLYDLLLRTNRAKEAAEVLGDSVLSLRSLTSRTADPRVSSALARALQSRGTLAYLRNELQGAEPDLREAVAALARIAADYPANPEYQFDLARSQSNLATLYMRLGQAETALTTHRAAVASAVRLSDNFPRVTEYRHFLAHARTNLGGLLADAGRIPEAEVVLGEALPVWEKLRTETPSSPTYLTGQVHTLAILGKAANRRKDYPRARGYLDRASQLRRASPGLMDHDPNGRIVMGILLWHQGHVLIQLGDHAAAAPVADELASLAGSSDADNAFNAGCYLARCSDLAARDQVLTSERRMTLADEYARRAIVHLKTAVGRGFKTPKLFATDEDLISLRGRPDFQEFLAGQQ